MKILLTGGEGQLASEILCEASKYKSISIKNYSKKSLDITKPIELQKVILNYNPDFIINAAAFTHTSVAIRDALDIFKKPIIELHISNIYKREEFRQKSLISDIVTGGIFGLGADGYILAIISMQKLLENEN